MNLNACRDIAGNIGGHTFGAFAMKAAFGGVFNLADSSPKCDDHTPGDNVIYCLWTTQCS